jgi:hypothetical protein
MIPKLFLASPTGLPLSSKSSTTLLSGVKSYPGAWKGHKIAINSMHFLAKVRNLDVSQTDAAAIKHSP